MFDSLKVAYDLLIHLTNAQYLVNLDSDTIHKPDWLTTLIHSYEDLKNTVPNRPIILSGFNADQKRNLLVRDTYVVKDNLGGINLFFDIDTYSGIVRKTLVNIGWDIELSRQIQKHDGLLIALRNSVIQHIGAEGMWSHGDQYDYSTTF